MEDSVISPSIPTPNNPALAPVWENGVVAHCSQAALGRIPRSALAVGVVVNDMEVELVFQLTALTGEDQADINDIVDELRTRLRPDVRISYRTEIVPSHELVLYGDTRWFFATHQNL